VDIRRDSEPVFGIKLFMLGFIVWNIPTLCVNTPYAQGSYYHAFESLPIVTTGRIPIISPQLPHVFATYPASFPGFSIWLSSFYEATGLNIVLVSKYFPLFSSTLMFLVIYLFFRTYVSGIYHRYALIVSVICNVYVQFQMSPQSLFFPLGLLTLIALEKVARGEMRLEMTLVSLLLFGSIVISHPTTLFLILSIVIVASLLKLALKRKTTARSFGDYMPVLFTVASFSWLVFNALTTQNDILNTLSSLLKLPFSDVVSGTAGTRSNLFSYSSRIRLVTLGFFATVSILVVLFQWFGKNKRKHPDFLIYTSFLLSPILLTFLDMFRAPSDRVYDRFFLFLLISAPIVLIELARLGSTAREHGKSKLARTRKINISRTILLSLVMLALAIGNFITFYSLAYSNISSPETIAASDFLDRKTDILVVGGYLMPSFSENYSSSWILRRIQFQSIYPKTLDSITVNAMVVFDVHSVEWYAAFYGSGVYQYYLNQSGANILDRVYDNGEYSMEFWKGHT
jgi:hypothetical protein